MSISHRFLIRLNVGSKANSLFDKTSTEAVKGLFSVIKEEMDKRIRRVKKATTTLKIGGGPSFDTTMKRFANTVDEKIHQRFYKNPPHWAPLGEIATKMREYRKNPEKFKAELFKHWYAGKDISPDIDLSLRSKSLDPMMQPGYPALLQTGALSRSVKIKYTATNQPSHLGNDNWVFRHARKISIARRPLPYANIQFNGQPTKVYFLGKKKKDGVGYSTKIYFPQDYLPELLSKKEQLSQGGFEIDSQWITPKPRNPLYFDQGDLNVLGDLLDRLGNSVEIDMKNIFAEDLSAFDTRSEARPETSGPKPGVEEDVF